jgi:membrane-bound lytic murein transglycosylase F
VGILYDYGQNVNPAMTAYRIVARRVGLFVCLWGTVATSSSHSDRLIDRIRDKGEIVVATLSGPTTYSLESQGAHGFEYDLVQIFAQSLGLKARFITVCNREGVLDAVAEGRADLAAAGLPVNPTENLRIHYGPVYQRAITQVVYNARRDKPESLKDLSRGTFEVGAGTLSEEALRTIAETDSSLLWKTTRHMDEGRLIELVSEELLDFTLAPSNLVSLSRRHHPELSAAFDVGETLEYAWAFTRADDSSLHEAAKQFFLDIENNGTLNSLLERYYGHFERLKQADDDVFGRDVAERMPDYVGYFKNAAERTGIDWRLLAAIGYQESRWDPKAVSPTGVQGIMMPPRSTASEIGVRNRRDPWQSILGGARYLNLVDEQIPERVPEPDRLWLKLAAYNVGVGHLDDARLLTRRQGANPNAWDHVKKRLPLLSKPKWYESTHHGYARGGEPVHFVEKVRNYYELLVSTFPDPEFDDKLPAPLVAFTTPGKTDLAMD